MDKDRYHVFDANHIAVVPHKWAILDRKANDMAIAYAVSKSTAIEICALLNAFAVEAGVV